MHAFIHLFFDASMKQANAKREKFTAFRAPKDVAEWLESQKNSGRSYSWSIVKALRAHIQGQRKTSKN